MKLYARFKAKFLDFEHPPKVRTLFIMDSIFISIILIVYALFQHVIPSMTIKNNTDTAESTIKIEGPLNVVTETSEEKGDEKKLLGFAVKFPEKFSDKITLNSRMYKSPNVSVEIEEYSTDEPPRQHWYVADIYVSDVQCLQTYVAGVASGNILATYDISELSRQVSSIVAINGDFAILNSSGLAIRNGTVLSQVSSLCEVCVLYKDGTIECYQSGEYDANEIIEKGAWQAWSFGPSLLDDNGRAKEEFSSYYGNLLTSHPRTILGYYEPGHYCFVTIDGRQWDYAVGMTMEEIAKLMEELGCKAAFNLDGGKSSQMTFGTSTVNRAIDGGRSLSDIVYIKDFIIEEEAS